LSWFQIPHRRADICLCMFGNIPIRLGVCLQWSHQKHHDYAVDHHINHHCDQHLRSHIYSHGDEYFDFVCHLDCRRSRRSLLNLMTLNFGGSVALLVRFITLSHRFVPHLNDVSNSGTDKFTTPLSIRELVKRSQIHLSLS
jgi:hypothetical protein